MNGVTKLKVLLGFVILLLLGAILFVVNKQSQKLPNIVIILIDTLRADHLGVYGYERDTSPNIDRFAKESVVFQRALSAASWTPPGTTSVLSGLYPSAHTNQPPKRLSTASHVGNKIPMEVKLLPELLKIKNYQTTALSSNPWITEEFGFDRGFDLFYYVKHMDAKSIIERSKKSIDRFLTKKDVPFFLYLHLIDPHDPYTSHPEYAYDGKLKEREYSETVMQKMNSYDSEIKFTDVQLGVFFEYLRAKGLYDDTIIVLVSDHGEAFDEHGFTGHGFNLNIEEVHVPLIIKGLSAPGTVTNTVSQVDIVPTILEKVGIAQPYALAGISLSNSDAIKNRTGVYAETYRIYRQRAFSTNGGERLIMEMGDMWNPKETMGPKGLYDLNKDPHEAKLLEDPLVFAELKGYLDSMVTKNTPLSTTQEVKIEDKTLEQLETLGYIN